MILVSGVENRSFSSFFVMSFLAAVSLYSQLSSESKFDLRLHAFLIYCRTLRGLDECRCIVADLTVPACIF